MLTWYDTPERDETGAVISMSYKAGIPHWGEAHIHPHPDHPGEAVLDCPELGIRMHSLGRVTAEEFYAWSEKAREKKAECDSGKISLGEFEGWLRES